jgi:hypothetical protein
VSLWPCNLAQNDVCHSAVRLQAQDRLSKARKKMRQDHLALSSPECGKRVSVKLCRFVFWIQLPPYPVDCILLPAHEPP